MNTPMETDPTKQLREAASLMDDALRLVCSLDEKDRKLVTYYTLATHALPALDTFPLLVLRGPMGTGKSQALRVISAFALRVRSFSLRGMTLPTIRDALSACENGTAAIEEGDHAWKDGDGDFERMLSDRYQRGTAKGSLKQMQRDKRYATVERLYFGATVLHRRLPFADPALNGRSVIIRFRGNNNRTYATATEGMCPVECGRKLVDGLTLWLPPIEQPGRVAARVFDTYKPLLACAAACADTGFLKLIGSRLELDTLALKDAQSVEPEALVLRALIDCMSYEVETKLNLNDYVPLRDLTESIWKNHRVPLRPQQAGAIARDLGFETKESHGITKVVPSAAVLLRACAEFGYEDDEVIADLKRQLSEGGAKQAG